MRSDSLLESCPFAISKRDYLVDREILKQECIKETVENFQCIGGLVYGAVTPSDKGIVLLGPQF
jgi:hypothetical protein